MNLPKVSLNTSVKAPKISVPNVKFVSAPRIGSVGKVKFAKTKIKLK